MSILRHAFGLLLASTTVAYAAGPARELVVVGVYRPVELSGRTLAAPREVYLAERGGDASALAALVGQELVVRRRVPVPATLPLEPSPGAAVRPEPPAAASGDRVEPARPAPVPTRDIEVTVGRVRVVAVRDGVAVAEVVADRLAEPLPPPPEPRGRKARKDRKKAEIAPTAPDPLAPAAVEMAVVMAGDVVRFDEPPPPPLPPPPAGVVPEEAERLRRERADLEAELKRRQAPPPDKYERPDPRWDL